MKCSLMKSLSAFGNRIDWKLLLFLSAIAGAVFLRVVHYEDWMIVKSDQIRDAMVSLHVVEDGWGALPLLGPRAGGTDLRLGPLFYYFQSFSGRLFGSASVGALAFPVLLFSLLSIPLFFLVARRLFDRDWAMLTTATFAYGFLGIEYARFSWNPNSTTFFALLFFYAFLRLLDEASEKRLRWYATLGVAYGVLSQLHFTALVAMPIFVALFSCFRFSRVRSVWLWKGFALFLSVVLFLSLPLLVADTLNGWRNAGEFLAAVGEKESSKSMVENVIRVVKGFGENFVRVTTGYFGGTKTVSYAGAALLGLFLALPIFLFRKERDESRKDFFLGIVLFGAAFFILFIPIATAVDKPRFYLPMLFVPTLLLGMISFSPFSRVRKKAILFVSAALLAASLVSNAFFAGSWLSEIRMSKYRYVSPKKDTIVLKLKKDDMWWSWGMIERATAFMIRDCPHENILIEYDGKSADFMHSFLYAFRLAGDERVRRSTKYDGPSFCRYELTKAKPGANAEDDTMDMGDLRIVVSDKRGGSPDIVPDEGSEEKRSKYVETWGDVF